MTFADFTGGSEANIEDMFDLDFYLRLVNEEFNSELGSPVRSTALRPSGMY